MIHQHKSSEWYYNYPIPMVVQVEVFVRHVKQTELPKKLFGYSKIFRVTAPSLSVVLQSPFRLEINPVVTPQNKLKIHKNYNDDPQCSGYFLACATLQSGR
jgi:hypothetical protein